MKTRVLGLLILPILAIVLMGCPYQSDVAVDNPNVKVDIALLGKWEDANNATSFGDQKKVYVVTKKSEYMYGIETTNYNYNADTEEYEAEKEVYEGHVSMINDTKFLNVKQTYPEPSSYYIYKMEVAGNNCILSEVSSCIDKKFTTSGELKSFLLKNLDNELLYSGSATFFRN